MKHQHPRQANRPVAQPRLAGHRPSHRQAGSHRLNGGGDGLAPAVGIDIAYPKFEDGSWDFDRALYPQPSPWAEWIKLPVREFDFVVATPAMQIRVPTVMISTQYAQMPVRVPRVTRQAIFERDQGVCHIPANSSVVTATSTMSFHATAAAATHSKPRLGEAGDQFPQGQPSAT